MDFFKVAVAETKKAMEIYPDFQTARSKDLMIRGGFYAVWDEERQIWSQDEYDVARLVDQELYAAAKNEKENGGLTYKVKSMNSFGSGVQERFRKWAHTVADNYHQLDDNLTFANQNVTKTDYVSRRLPYPLVEGDYSAWDELLGTLYSVDERQKIEWAIGAIVSGDSKKIQKFLVLYGPAGTGKSTILNIVEKLFEGYKTSFEAKSLTQNGNSFSTEMFRHNPLVAIQHDGDLSKIEDNTKLNSIVSHEEMTMNEKYKQGYTSRVNAFLFMGTNQPVKISDAKSGIIRRLIDVHPTGVTIPPNHYNTLMSRIDFELGAIASHCLGIYRLLGKNFYNGYRPVEMMFQTDVFFNFIESYFDVFKAQDGITLKQAYNMYKEYCSETGLERVMPQYKMREELRNYFDEFKDRAEIDGVQVRSYYSGFNSVKFKQAKDVEAQAFSLVMEEKKSLLDDILADFPAQYVNAKELPQKKWENVKTTLSELDTSLMHYTKVPLNHIVIDFDLKDLNGHKSLERNLEAASVWPPTYSELSKSGAGVHLHYNYLGDAALLKREYSDGIEIKVFTGEASLRRRLTRCNAVPVGEISGLPEREKRMLSKDTIQSEKGLREMIARNLRKEIHPGTKPSVDFIHKILEDAYASGMAYDVTDMRNKIMAFANNSSNQPLLALKVVQSMKFASEKAAEGLTGELGDERLVFYDVEVYPNLFIVCWKYEGDPNVTRMINPKYTDVEALFQLKLVGFNNRRYDNHILYAAHMGYNNEELFTLSQKLISNDRNASFGEAYNLSYCDIWDISSKKQGLKKFEIDLGIHHMELNFPWDEAVPEENWAQVEEYCVNDVIATELVFQDRKQDFVARQILAELSGLSVNDTTQRHTAEIVFGKDRKPQDAFKYTDLSDMFPGYVFDLGKSSYRGENPGEGGYVYAEPGMYENVALLDVASMHPTSITLLDAFGPEYTRKFSELVEARLAIKGRDYPRARTLLDGRLGPFLDDERDADALSYALKIVINIVYGLTSAKFSNPFRDNRNVDNIVAKRGALFMIDLKHAVQEKGFTVAHIKTDSIKIPDATVEITEFVKEFGAKYGYTFELEAIYDKFVLLNDAVYVARKGDEYTAVGAQFQHPVVYKTLFSKEPLVFDDYCETRSVLQGVMYLDFEARDKPAALATGTMQHVGRTGRFVPVEEGGGILYRVKDDGYYAVTETKGRFWVEAEIAKTMGDKLKIDMNYFEQKVDKAIAAIDYFGPFMQFTS